MEDTVPFLPFGSDFFPSSLRGWYREIPVGVDGSGSGDSRGIDGEAGVGDGIVRCVSVRPRLEDGRMVFRHEFRMLSDPDVKELFGDGVPEDVLSRREEAKEVRRLARMVGRFEGLKELVPIMTEYADSLDGGRR